MNVERKTVGDGVYVTATLDADSWLLLSEEEARELHRKLGEVLAPPALTPRQRQALDLILSNLAALSVSPTQQELADAMGVSKTTVHLHVSELVKKGVLVRDKFKSRSLRVVGQAGEVA